MIVRCPRCGLVQEYLLHTQKQVRCKCSRSLTRRHEVKE